ncbi:MAG: complex I NDUFA9 subunit family protein [Caulobacteraceae bacterium]
MKGLVTVFGGSGFVGAQIVRALAKRGLRVRVAVRRPGRGYRLRMLGEVGQVEIVQANIRDAASVGRALDGAEACVNAVGVLHESGRQTFEAVHVDGVRAIAGAAAARGIQIFVHLSAIGADPASRSVYARTKAAGETASREAIASTTVMRPSIVFGAADRFFNRFAAMATLSPALPLIGGGATRFQPVFVTDVANAVGEAAIQSVAAGRTYELGGPAVRTFRELMELMLREIGRSRLLVPIPFGVASLMGAAGDLVAATGLIAPPITRDQVDLLRSDNVVSADALGLADLGIVASAMEPIVPTYLYRYRKGGQYAELTRAAAALPAR